ncbi:Pentatricopeptide repeat-containing protein, mitochondrial [Sesamum angolense]|uniref:Pentatricopeptide repeat-containing protein, mitochondrial n=1 Tax=Sesamum angolense TaxID=2727404 RepID=A0AAE2BKN2_9LAMI|nr:Pentatricopeptide repeat-containing protein, mitochondrial [Sesamum angolense]
MIRSGYEPDRLTYHLLVKMLCKEGKLDLTVQIIKEMRARGFDLDLASSTMLMHLLWRMRRYDEAVFEFQDMFRRGIIPQHLTYRRMAEELERRGMTETAKKLHGLMKSVPHSTKLPDTYRGHRNSSHERKISIIQRAEAMSDILKTCENPRELVKHKNRPENAVLIAQKLMDSIQQKSNLRDADSFVLLGPAQLLLPVNQQRPLIVTSAATSWNPRQTEQSLNFLPQDDQIDGKNCHRYFAVARATQSSIIMYHKLIIDLLFPSTIINHDNIPKPRIEFCSVRTMML